MKANAADQAAAQREQSEQTRRDAPTPMRVELPPGGRVLNFGPPGSGS